MPQQANPIPVLSIISVELRNFTLERDRGSEVGMVEKYNVTQEQIYYAIFTYMAYIL